MSAAVALLAGGAVMTALGLGAAMTLLQLGIGTVNDVVDAPRDRGHKPGKPIPAGLVGKRLAVGLALGFFAGGLALSATVAVPVVGLAVVVIAIGLAYDLWLKGTAWSWVPFAAGIPILPVFGWLGARGSLPPAFGLLIPVAMIAGAGLALANALVDVERDRAAGVTSLASRLGVRRSGLTTTALLAIVWALAVGSAVVSGAPGVMVGLVAAVGAVPVAISGWAIGREPAARERAWQVACLGLAGLSASWLWLIGETGGLR